MRALSRDATTAWRIRPASAVGQITERHAATGRHRERHGGACRCGLIGRLLRNSRWQQKVHGGQSAGRGAGGIQDRHGVLPGLIGRSAGDRVGSRDDNHPKSIRTFSRPHWADNRTAIFTANSLPIPSWAKISRRCALPIKTDATRDSTRGGFSDTRGQACPLVPRIKFKAPRGHRRGNRATRLVPRRSSP